MLQYLHLVQTQDADIVTFIYRPDYYKIQEWEDGENCMGQAEIIVAKHRNGGLDNLRLKFIKELGRFENIDDFDSPYEFHSKMNAAANDDTFKPDPNQAFNLPDNSDLPF
jgi:replicative DNA helicase